MRIRDEAIDKFYMEVIDILGRNYDTDLAKAANIAEQIAEMVNDMVEGGDAE